MATLEEIAQQFENALGTETGTTIAPGTISPVGVTASGKKKLSWAEVVQKMADNAGVYSNELLPDVPKGVSAQTFYRTGVKSGMLPQGLATFTSSPFGSFKGRMGVAQGATSAETAPSSNVPAAPVSVAAPKSAIQTQQDHWTSADMESARLSILDPHIDPNKGFADLLALIASPGMAIAKEVFGFEDDKDKESKGNPYYDYGTYTPDEIGYMIDNGMMNEAQQKAYQNGIDRMDFDGFAVNENGYHYSNFLRQDEYSEEENKINTELYKKEELKRIADHPLTKFTDWMGLDEDRTGMRGKYTPGYQHNKDPEGRWSKGQFVGAGGKVYHGGMEGDFKELVDKGDRKSLDLAKWMVKTRTISYELQQYLNKADRNKPVLIDKNPSHKSQNLHLEKPDPNKPPPIYPQVPNMGGDDGGGDGGDGGGAYSAPADTDYDSLFAQGGRVAMQEGGEAPQMPQMPQMPQEGQEAEMANLGMINEQAAQPQNGGEQSVKDDIPREADEGDYILPYETVLEVGLKQLNRYAKEAIQLAIKNDVNLKGTDLDPTDDVPIKVSNYEYHIPKGLVPYFGGGKKYLDKIRDEGLALRKRLEEEKQPSAKEQQPMQPPTQPQAAPEPQPQPQQAPEQAPEQAPQMPQMPQMPMMAKGGFVNDPIEALQSAEQALTSDTSQPTQSAYNQVQALERARMQKQQPPMVDPSGKVVQQGFAAPQGYALGTPEGGVTAPVLPVEEQAPPVEEQAPPVEEVPSTQMELSSAPNETQVAGSSPSSFNEAFKTASEAGKTEFMYNGKPYNTQKSGDAANFEKLKTLEIEKVMALTAMAEAQKEGRAGMQAVMHVINNRAKSGRTGEFGNKFPGEPHRSVILHPNAFTALRGYTMGDPKEKKNFQRFMDIDLSDSKFQDAVQDARDIMSGELEDTTNNSLFYFNPKTVDMPKHLKDMRRKTVIGGHHFYNEGGFVERVVDSS